MHVRILASKLATWSAALIVAALMVVPAQTQTYTVLHSFNSLSERVLDVKGGLIRDGAGNLYGNADIYLSSDGGIFKLTPDGTATAFYTFTGRLDGYDPAGQLAVGPGGNLYGTAGGGGANQYGTAFELTLRGDLIVLHAFGTPSDGLSPIGGLLRDAQGNLYGTTNTGGPAGGGTVFKINISDDSEAILHSTTYDEGYALMSGVVMDQAGDLYGTASYGGAYGYGTIYKIDPAGELTVLHSFTAAPDGRYPIAALVMDPTGDLYGTTPSGGGQRCGEFLGCGMAFKIDAAGNYTVLANFGGSRGKFPDAAMVRDPGGNLYGVAQGGGASNCDCGVLFEITASGKQKVLHTFLGGTDGAFPNALIISGGTLYGSTQSGGLYDSGTVFQYTLK